MAYKGTTQLAINERIIIEEGLKNGLKTGTIAQTLQRSHSCIKQEIRKGGGREKYNAEAMQLRAHRIRQAGIQKISFGFTEEQAIKIHKMVEDGLSMNRISKEIPCSRITLRKFLDKMNIKVQKKSYMDFITRVEALEQQLDLIFELIKEMKNDPKN